MKGGDHLEKILLHHCCNVLQIFQGNPLQISEGIKTYLANVGIWWCSRNQVRKGQQNYGKDEDSKVALAHQHKNCRATDCCSNCELL